MSERTAVVPFMPPRLKARLEHYKIELPAFAPTFDRIFVAPLDTADQPDTTAGGIVIARQTQQQYGAQRGLLVMAGAKAIEQLYAHGIAIGDIVITARLSVWERQYMAKGRPHKVLIVRASEIVGSEDLQAAYEKGDLWLEMNVAEGSVALADRENGERKRSDPQDSYEG